jgi:hypothetical protein
MIKNYNLMYNVGTVKYIINLHNGIDTHNDGSPFYGIKTFKNKKKFNSAIKDLKNDGYVLQ